MRALGLVLAAGSIGIAAPATADDDTVILEPASDWQLREMDDRCRLSRRFGTGEDRTTLWIDKGGSGTSVNLTLIGRPFRHLYGTNVRVALGNSEPVVRNYIKSKSSRGRPVMALFGVRMLQRSDNGARAEESKTAALEADETVDIESGEVSGPYTIADGARQLDEVRTLTLSGAVIKPVSLEWGALSEAMGDLQACTNELISRWSEQASSPSEGGTLAYSVNQEDWAKKIQVEYPFHLLMSGQEATLAVRVTVNANGRASFCEIVDYSGPASFNDTACLLMLRHSRFSPATNSNGEPVPALWQTRITYRINS